MKSGEYVTSDHHFGHANVIRYSKRSFSNAQEMDEKLIEAWNKKVPPGATVYHLGDFCFDRPKRLIEIRKRLNGTIRLVKGNHDKAIKGPEVLSCFEWVKDYYESKAEDGTKIVMCHYPFMTWNKGHHGAWCFHGHCHGNLRHPETVIAKTLKDAGHHAAADLVSRVFDKRPRRIDVGVDNHPNYEPFSFEEIQAKMADKEHVPVDHHV